MGIYLYTVLYGLIQWQIASTLGNVDASTKPDPLLGFALLNQRVGALDGMPSKRVRQVEKRGDR